MMEIKLLGFSFKDCKSKVPGHVFHLKVLLSIFYKDTFYIMAITSKV